MKTKITRPSLQHLAGNPPVAEARPLVTCAIAKYAHLSLDVTYLQQQPTHMYKETNLCSSHILHTPL